MTDELKALIEKCRNYTMSPEEMLAQEISFAYGNAVFENPRITKEGVRNAMVKLKSSDGRGV